MSLTSVLSYLTYFKNIRKLRENLNISKKYALIRFHPQIQESYPFHYPIFGANTYGYQNWAMSVAVPIPPAFPLAS